MFNKLYFEAKAEIVCGDLYRGLTLAMKAVRYAKTAGQVGELHGLRVAAKVRLAGRKATA